jgi:hypothetical protein
MEGRGVARSSLGIRGKHPTSNILHPTGLGWARIGGWGMEVGRGMHLWFLAWVPLKAREGRGRFPRVSRREPRLGVVPACYLRGALARAGRRSVVFPFYFGCIPVVFRLYSGCSPVVRLLCVLYIFRLGPLSSRGGIGMMIASLPIPWFI